jgi:hypothetical protein
MPNSPQIEVTESGRNLPRRINTRSSKKNPIWINKKTRLSCEPSPVEDELDGSGSYLKQSEKRG